MVGLAVDALYIDQYLVQRIETGSKHTQVHDVVAANSAVVDDDVPGPKSDGVPLRTVYQ